MAPLWRRMSTPQATLAVSVPSVDDGESQALRGPLESGSLTQPGTHAIHRLGCYRERFAFARGDYPEARDRELTTMALPLHNRMAEQDVDGVVTAIRFAALNCAG